MALALTLNRIISALDSGEHVIGSFLDLKKAFDTINFDILFSSSSKLCHYGIPGRGCNLLNYLNII